MRVLDLFSKIPFSEGEGPEFPIHGFPPQVSVESLVLNRSEGVINRIYDSGELLHVLVPHERVSFSGHLKEALDDLWHDVESNALGLLAAAADELVYLANLNQLKRYFREVFGLRFRHNPNWLDMPLHVHDGLAVGVYGPLRSSLIMTIHEAPTVTQWNSNSPVVTASLDYGLAILDVRVVVAGRFSPESRV
jgi:hypothetical protein